MAPRRVEEVWLGKPFSSEEHVVALSFGLVVRSGAVLPYPDVESDLELFDGIRWSPWDPSATGVEGSAE